jgi:membrane associated rhomboid family serine protease
MAGTPDLFVVCKKCGSEVSPYITECPYCGTRLRKRAPKIDRRSGQAAPKPPRRALRPTLSPLRAGEIPGIRGDATARPIVTLAILALSLFGYLVLSFVADGDLALRTLDGDPWKYATSLFAYPNTWYELACLLTIGICGWRLEQRHGWMLVLVLFLVCGAGGNAIAAAVGADDFIFGAPGAALGLLSAWVLPDLRRVRRGVEHDADLIGAGALGVAVALMPAVTPLASAVATFSGLALGTVTGAALLRTAAARR